MAILTISHEMGSGGAEIGMALATRLGYTYVDNEELLGRAQRYGLAEERLARLVEDRPSWVERFDAETRRCILALQAVLYEFAQADNVVLIGGGGQWLLRGVPHALRTRIVAPFPERVTRLTATLSAQGRERVTPKTVAQFIRRDDIQKASRMRYLFDADIKDPGLYDILINTAVLLPRGGGGAAGRGGPAARVRHHGRGQGARGRPRRGLPGGGRARRPSRHAAVPDRRGVHPRPGDARAARRRGPRRRRSRWREASRGCGTSS